MKRMKNYSNNCVWNGILCTKYIHNIDKVTILDQVHTITIDSPEVQRLKEKADKIDELERLVKKIMEKNKD